MKTKGRRQSKNVERRGEVKENPFDLRSNSLYTDAQTGDSAHGSLRALRRAAEKRKIAHGASKAPASVANAMDKAARADKAKTDARLERQDKFRGIEDIRRERVGRGDNPFSRATKKGRLR